MIAWLKRHHWLHSWSQWKQRWGWMTPIVKGLPTESMTIHRRLQERQCAVCGKVQKEWL